jgi:hypothetical protein
MSAEVVPRCDWSCSWSGRACRNEQCLAMRDTLVFIVILSVIVVAMFALFFLECHDDARGRGGLSR